jgi:xanthine/uracil/vitamin C permease (AzgA family)
MASEQPRRTDRTPTFISNYFGFERAGTTIGREFVAGLTTFVTMSYIIVVNPAILKAAGIAVVALMSFTYNIGIGITAGFVLYPFCKVVAGRGREIKPGLWVLAGLSLLFFIFYPYT